MNEIDELRQERESKHAIYIQFLAEYDKHKKEHCYGFVEGKDDPSYYRCIINKEIPHHFKIRLFPTGNKKTVKEVYDCFDWRRFQKSRIVFFMDRDLSDIIPDESMIIASNVYITDKYAIENDIANSDTYETILRDVMGFATTDQESIDRMVNLFEQQKEIFERLMIPVMSNIIFWKKIRLPSCNYNNINVKDIIRIQNAVIQSLKIDVALIGYIYTKSNVDIAVFDELEVNEIQVEIEKDNMYKKIIRGKYVTTFFIQMCNSVIRDCVALNIIKTHAGAILGEPDMTKIVAPRCRVPDSLKLFIDTTLIDYISKVIAA